MKPMTAQEAWDNCAYYSCIPTVADKDGVDLRHAMKIMDALVASHNARRALESLPFDPADTGFDWHTEPLWEASKNADDKLRTLEAGEDPQ